MFIPENGVIDTTDPDGWVFPVGTIFWKTFSRGGMRLETRILTKVAAGEGMDSWTYQTYVWNQTQNAVTLVGVDGLENVLGTTHDIPSREDCLSCHAASARDVGLGFGAIQLADANLPLTLDDLAAAGEMSNTITMASAATPGTTIQRNALGYLHANCAHCHGGSSPQVGLNMQLEVGLTGVCETNTYLTALAATDDMAGGCTTPGTDSFWGAASMKRVAPNSIATSAVYQRMNVRTLSNQMPPIGTEDVDTLGLMTIQTWIMGGVPHMGPDLGPCNGLPTCCGDGIVQANEECEPGLPPGNPDRCPTNPGSDCNQSGGTQCIEGTNCLARCVPENPLNPALFCPL